VATGTAGRRRGGRLAATVLALLVHVAFLLALLASLRPLITPEAPVLVVELVRPERRAFEPPPSTLEAKERPAPPPGFQAPLRPFALGPTGGAPGPLAPFPAPASAAAGPGGPSARPNVGEELAGALRTTIGCDRDAGLTARERTECRRRLGEAARNLEPIPGAPEKRGSWAGEPDPTKPRVRPYLGPAPTAVAPAIDPGGVTIGARVSVPFGHPPKALPPIPPSALRGDDDALRPKRRPAG
jgi:hypothetical protein